MSISEDEAGSYVTKLSEVDCSWDNELECNYHQNAEYNGEGCVCKSGYVVNAAYTDCVVENQEEEKEEEEVISNPNTDDTTDKNGFITFLFIFINFSFYFIIIILNSITFK